MKNRFCERCERITTDGHLWCERTDCPAEAGYPVFVYGDYLGDLKIVKMIRLWRTAALYEAWRGKDTVFVKVAHKGDDCEERLKREAVALAGLAKQPSLPFVQSFLPSRRPILPAPLSPYPVPSKRPYGEISFRGEIKFYTVFKHAEGKLLSDLMLENPQLWHYQAAWIIITLAEAMRPLAANNKCHLCLSPDMILVDVDKQGILRPLLLDIGFILAGNEIESVYEWPKLGEPGYTAPELLATRPKAVSPNADVYSMGTIFYQMLAGKTAFDSKLRRDEKIREAVTQHRGALPVDRAELEHAGVVKIVEQALAPTNRYNSVVDMAKALVAIYSTPPKEKRPLPTRTKVILTILGLLFLVVLGIVAFLLIQLAMTRFTTP